jgi:hypothetical protein
MCSNLAQSAENQIFADFLKSAVPLTLRSPNKLFPQPSFQKHIHWHPNRHERRRPQAAQGKDHA